MTEMVERVARAILAAHDWTQNPVTAADGSQVNPEVTGWDTLTPDWHECFRAQARAAIEAMREPTHLMRRVCWDQLEGSARVGNLRPGHIAGDGHPDVLLRKMINAALTEETQP